MTTTRTRTTKKKLARTKRSQRSIRGTGGQDGLPHRAQVATSYAASRRAPRFLAERLRAFFRAGTLPPARRASERPIAMACLRLVTFLPERPERSFPCFISDMDRSTFCDAFFP